MSKLLEVQGVIIYHIKEKKEGFFVKIGTPRKPSCCLYCSGKTIHNHGTLKERTIRHGLTVLHKPIWLLWKTRRYQCASCKKTWGLPPPKTLVTGKKRFTEHCLKQALHFLKESSFGNAKRQSGLSYATLRRALHEIMQTKPLMMFPQKHEGDVTLGIDAHARAKRTLALTVTLLKPERKLLALLPHATTHELVHWAERELSLSERLRVTEISVDMTQSLKKQLMHLFPNAHFVIDHFHVVAYLNTLIAREFRFQKEHLPPKKKRHLPFRGTGFGVSRLLYQGGTYWTERQKEQIRTVCTMMPEIATLWYLKEEVRAIYKESLSRKEAQERWQYVLKNLPKKEQRTLSSFLEEILNYHTNKTTNAYTEGIHTKCKLIKRLSFGLKNPQVYVEKLSLAFLEPSQLTISHRG
jgi:transposase